MEVAGIEPASCLHFPRDSRHYRSVLEVNLLKNQSTSLSKGRLNDADRLCVGLWTDGRGSSREGGGEHPQPSVSSVLVREVLKDREEKEYRQWREKRGINPWVGVRTIKNKHRKVRTDVRGKKNRMEIAGNYNFMFFRI